MRVVSSLEGMRPRTERTITVDEATGKGLGENMSTPDTYATQAQALRTLECAGFDVKELWRELARRSDVRENAEPTEEDVKWATRADKPTPVAEHLMSGEAGVSVSGNVENTPEELCATNCFEDRQYTLSSGMRQTLLEMYNLTPTKVVVVSKVETFPGGSVIRRLTMESAMHVDPRVRKHALVKADIFPASEFFKKSAEREKEKEVERGNLTELVESALTLGRIINLCSEDRWAIADLCGVKVGAQVEVLRTSPASVTFLCLKSGNKATVAREELLTTVEEYVKLHKVAPLRKGRMEDPTPALDALIAGLL